MKKFARPAVYVTAVIAGAVGFIICAAIQTVIDKSRRWTLEQIIRREG